MSTPAPAHRQRWWRTSAPLLGADTAAPTLEQVVDAIAAASVVALVVDSYERFGAVDGWPRNRLLPALRAGTTTVLVGRNPPNVAWRTAPGGRPLLADMLVGPLTESGAHETIGKALLEVDPGGPRW